MRPRDIEALDFPRVCARIADFAVSEAGKEACRALRPTADAALAEARIERMWQCHRLLETHGDPPLGSFPDVRAHLRSAAHEGFVLDGKSLVEMRSLLVAVREVGAFFRRHAAEHAAIVDLPLRMPAFPVLETSLARSLDDDGGVLDQASDELAAVRAKIRRVRDTLGRRLEELVHRQSLAEIVADTYVTLRNNRFVIPVRAAAAAQLSGVVQDRSVSGETVFVEPLFAVELNNQLMMAAREEDAIVRRILSDLTALVRADHAAIAAAAEALAEADCLVARARFARLYRCTRPAFTRRAIALEQARHPVLLFTGRPVTPTDLLLPDDKDTLVITGPNTGGKTVALKSLGLAALMAQSGILIPAAEGARLPCFPAVFTDVGDEQNIERSLSTFSAHVANLSEIIAAGTLGALVLLDEPGVGTDPEEGAALAIGTVDLLEKRGARVALTTHYAPVKRFALGRSSCLLAAVDFEVETLTPLYRLSYHTVGRSLGLPIAERLGLPSELLEAARAAVSEESRAFAAAVERLEDTRQRLERELAEAEERSKQTEEREAESRRLVGELRERRQRAWGDELREARAFLRRTKEEGRALLKEIGAGVEERVALQRRLREQEAEVDARTTAQTVTVPRGHVMAGQPKPGDTVEVGERGIRGELLSIEGERAWIQRGSMRFEVPAAQLVRVERAPRQQQNVRLNVERPAEDTAQVISLVGLRAREAVSELDRFLDRAVRAGQARVRVVHGVGSGALKRAVHDYLSSSPYCSEFQTADGNEAVTLAILNE
jgi:DNA mismatch repair protein MutS2